MKGRPRRHVPALNATQQHSAFSLRLGHTNYSSSKVIVFRNVIFNGQNHYSTKTGVFTCATPGLYQFSYHCTSFVTAGSVDLWRNGTLELQGFQSFQGGTHTFMGDLLLQLARGDQVRLEATRGNKWLSSSSTFSGHLLFTI